MYRLKPTYFDRVYIESKNRWDTLESDPVLAAPWKQLFRQVQSPDHVLSELLQNADDAEATWVNIYLENNIFYFEHNGQDFDEDSLKSLCRFGFSNKRHLHTIGFRGIGFKSTFSLGSRVEIWTQSIAIAFEADRFTEPIWLEDAPISQSTTIRIEIKQIDKVEWLRKNLKRWSSSAVPILFFRNIQQLNIQDCCISKNQQGLGPIPRSEWIELNNNGTQRVLKILSSEEPFPVAPLEEVRQERGDDQLELPPCHVELILGLTNEQRLYVVLPTGITPKLPFSCNAPFVQDPARTSIKDPITSPTNRWLLKRVGELAASAMELWLKNTTLSPEARTEAYKLLPERPIIQAEDLGCTQIILEQFQKKLGSTPLLLAQSGHMAHKEKCWELPAILPQVWTEQELLEWLNQDVVQSKQYILSSYISDFIRQRLANWQLLDGFGLNKLSDLLQRSPYPMRPSQPDRIKILWSYLSSHIFKARTLETYRIDLKKLAIVPVRNKNRLYPTELVTVVGKPDTRLSEADWQFLTDNILIVEPAWIQNIRAVDNLNLKPELAQNDQEWRNASELFQQLGLSGSHPLERLINKINQSLNASSVKEKIWLAQIAAKADVQVPEDFYFLCEDEEWRNVSQKLLSGILPSLEDLLPSHWKRQHIVSYRYTHGLSQQDQDTWQRWVNSPKSRLQSFPQPLFVERILHGKFSLKEFCTKHRGHPPQSYRGQKQKFIIKTYNFDEELWSHWKLKAQANPKIWSRLVYAIATSWDVNWLTSCNAEVRQSSGSNTYPLECGALEATWLNCLKSYPCIPDMFSKLCYPHELLRHTADTAPLENIELFVHPDYDRPGHEAFLDRLGVSKTPANADRLVERLRTLATLDHPPIKGLLNLYNALDRITVRLSTNELERLRNVFADEQLIRAEDGSWQRRDSIFQMNSQEIPKCAVILPGASHLSLWNQLQVAEQPTLELAIAWLANLQRYQILNSAERTRARSILQRAPLHIWNELGCWLNADSQWVTTNQLRWRVRDLATSTLFVQTRREIADLSMFSVEEREQPLFEELDWLDSAIEMRVSEAKPSSFRDHQPSWIQVISTCILQINPPTSVKVFPNSAAGIGQTHTAEPTHPHTVVLASEDNPHLINRASAIRLQSTQWQLVTMLIVEPYLEGRPVGQAHRPNVLWKGQVFYVRGTGPQYHQDVVTELMTQFNGAKLRDAIAACVSRETTWIQAYFEANFSLNLNTVPFNSSHLLTSDSSGAATDLIVLPPSIPITYPENVSNFNKGSDVSRTSHPRLQQTRLNIFKQWAINLGFQWYEEAKQFIHENGSRICKDHGITHWIQYDGAGHPTDWYWEKNQSINQGVVIPAEVWERMRLNPKHSWFVLLDEVGAIQAYRQDRLQQWSENGEMLLSPATYRLRLSPQD